ncbi:MAG: ThiF family adenylyltransferase [Thiobacillus sp.]|nr:ThiF family adenylyltransferase [Thiobacillus sp.]
MSVFNYEEAFSRNIGWFTPSEQHALRSARVAIAGMGGVGGVHLLTLARLGVGRFRIADLDRFALVNFNRQAGASCSSLDQEKTAVMARMARDINPELELDAFSDGVSAANIDAFLRGVDVYVDGLDYFVFETRRMVYDACRARGIPVVLAVPLGMGASLLHFLPEGPGFEDYFRLEDGGRDEWPVRFLAGVAPALLHRHYLAYPEIVDFAAQRVPSTGAACQICSGLAATSVAKLLLGRGGVVGVPRSSQFDAYTGRFKRVWRPGGNRHPLQRLAIGYINYRLRRAGKA